MDLDQLVDTARRLGKPYLGEPWMEARREERSWTLLQVYLTFMIHYTLVKQINVT